MAFFYSSTRHALVGFVWYVMPKVLRLNLNRDKGGIMRRVVFAEEQIYHIFNRGTDKREVFLNDLDRYRFLGVLREMNDPKPVLNFGYFFDRNNIQQADQGKSIPHLIGADDNALVDILAFVLMPNHYHLLLTQRVQGGVAAFMHKLGTAYTMYFNKKYQRTGVLFQGRFKAVMIKNDGHFDGIPYYIHGNPLKLGAPFTSIEAQVSFLKAYKWSSFRDYAGIRNFPSVTKRDLLGEFFLRDGGVTAGMSKWLQNRKSAPIEAQPQ